MRSRRPSSRRSSPVTFSPSSVEPHQHLEFQRADEQVALPGRKQRAGVERHAGRRDRGHPVFHRLLHAGLVRALVDFRAVVIDAVADHRPAVVLALLDDVDLVAALRAVLFLPQLAVGRIDGEAFGVAVAVAPDFRPRAGFADERIVGRHRTVGSYAHDLADGVGEVLRVVARDEMIAERYEQIAVGCLHDAAGDIVAAGRWRAGLAEDDFHVIEPRRARRRSSARGRRPRRRRCRR